VLQIFQTYFPKSIFIKIKKYTTTKIDILNTHVNWLDVKNKLDNINLKHCQNDLIKLLQDIPYNINNVKYFHISNNDKINESKEPNQQKTCQMIYNFLGYIYQRNIISSIIKYILLHSELHKFKQIEYQNHKRDIFSLMHRRLEELIFECIITAFNGENYDFYLLCNYLIIIQTKLKEKIFIFKKGASISTIILRNKHNLNKFSNILKKDSLPLKKTNNKWLSKLYFKDIRNLVASNMSLDKVGHLFNLNIPKLCFPYNQAVSIKKLKSLTSLYPDNKEFWFDNLTNKVISLETKQLAQELYNNLKFKNLYEYGTYYLGQDCLLLYSIVMTLFDTYLSNNINLLIRRNFSQSSLAYQQLFIIEPAKQIKEVLAPKQIKHSFFNYLIKQAVTGGICTSHVHGTIGNGSIINEHFNYIENPHLNSKTWSNFANIQLWNKSFHETATNLVTFDIRSLYPSAACKPIPIGSPLFYTRLTKHCNITSVNLRTLDINSICNEVENNGCFLTDTFQLLSSPPKYYTEFNMINLYLKNLPDNIKILRFQTSFTALGQLYFDNYPVDGFLSFQNPNENKIYIKIIQYNSNFYHGHKSNCSILKTEKELQKHKRSLYIKQSIMHICNNYKSMFSANIEFEYVELSECDYFQHKIPFDSVNYMIPYKKTYTYNYFLQNIYNKNIKGFLVVKDLEIRKSNQNPIFGFIIQKVEYDLKKLSPYTSNLLKYFNKGSRVVALNKSDGFMVISTEYFVWLYKVFGFEKTPDIYHALLFQTSYYLRENIENKLKERKELKDLIKQEKNIQIKQNYEIKAELIKLMLNSCYGFTLCNLTSSKFKCLTNRTSMPKHKNKKKKILSCIQIANNIYLTETKEQLDFSFQSLLGQVGCSILFNSKIIFLKRLYFLLKYFNPSKAQLLYMDTDSAHFLLKHKILSENVDSNLRELFLNDFPKHFETGNKISGIWVHEGTFEYGEYLGEKSYKLYDKTNNSFISHMKGLNKNFQQKYVTENINIKKNPFIAYNIFMKSPDFLIFKSYMSKNLFSNFVPIKRYFVSALGSLPLKF